MAQGLQGRQQVWVAWSPGGLCAIWVAPEGTEAEKALRERFPSTNLVRGGAEAREALAQVVAHRDDPTRPVTLPLNPAGTPFQLHVWRTLSQIPLGKTWTYQQLAARCGRPAASRAVASACAHNPLAPLVPCHRVLRSNGQLGGYLGGLAEKVRLLRLEGVCVEEA